MCDKRVRFVTLLMTIVLALIPMRTVWGQNAAMPSSDAFRVSWDMRGYGEAAEIEGHVHNGSPFRVTDVQLRVEGLDAASRPVGQTSAWTFGDIAPGADGYFVVDAIDGASVYRITVTSFDVVSH
jgi:hypothetical protein